nr:MAG TPA: hypothetical protein [Caudoviricetes sp.]
MEPFCEDAKGKSPLKSRTSYASYKVISPITRVRCWFLMPLVIIVKIVINFQYPLYGPKKIGL